MRYLTAFVIALLIACTVMQCAGGPRSSATRIKTARTKRLDEIDGI